MLLTLLPVTLAVSLLVCFLVARLFSQPILDILTRLVGDALRTAWHRYLCFAIYVVGVSGGVRIWSLERYVTPRSDSQGILELNADRWLLEVYRTIIETLQGVAWMLLVFFIFALIAYVILRGFELRRQTVAAPNPGPSSAENSGNSSC